MLNRLGAFALLVYLVPLYLSGWLGCVASWLMVKDTEHSVDLGEVVNTMYDNINESLGMALQILFTGEWK